MCANSEGEKLKPLTVVPRKRSIESLEVNDNMNFIYSTKGKYENIVVYFIIGFKMSHIKFFKFLKLLYTKKCVINRSINWCKDYKIWLGGSEFMVKKVSKKVE